MGQKKFSANEYNSIRTEMISRINVISNQTSTALITIISMWTAGFTLLILYSQKEFKTVEIAIIMGYISAILFLIPILYFIPLAIKSGENMVQIASLSMYIRVFYDALSVINGDELYNWETSNNRVSNVNIDRGTKSGVLRWINSEYSILAVSSYMLFIMVSVLGIIKIYQLEISEGIRIVLMVIYCILALAGIIAIMVIQRVASVKNTLMEYTDEFAAAYMRRAQELGFINSESEYATMWAMVDPHSKGNFFNGINP